MYYQNYEDYMRSVLGYPIEQRQNTYEDYSSVMPYETSVYAVSNNYSDEIMNLYPEIYRLVNPMVCKICEANTKPITRDLLEQMTEEIYLNIENTPEVDNIVNVRVNVPKETTNTTNNRTPRTNTTNNNRANLVSKTETKAAPTTREEPKETRQIGRNRNLQDLIRILILNQLLGGGRPPRPPQRPPYPPRPPRPMPPRPREDGGYNDYFRF